MLHENEDFSRCILRLLQVVVVMRRCARIWFVEEDDARFPWLRKSGSSSSTEDEGA